MSDDEQDELLRKIESENYPDLGALLLEYNLSGENAAREFAT